MVSSITAGTPASNTQAEASHVDNVHDLVEGVNVFRICNGDLRSPAREAVQQDGFLGIFLGGLKAAAGGITAAIVAGLIASLLFKAKDKS